MAAQIPDSLWDLIVPLSPPPVPKPKGGRPRLSDRACFGGIVFVLRSGIPWQKLPQDMGCGSGMNCWRRPRGWPPRWRTTGRLWNASAARRGLRPHSLML